MSRTTRPRRILALVTALALGAAACGGDGGGDGDAARDDVDVDASRCPVDALEGAEDPVRIDYWHAMAAGLGEELEALVEEYNSSQDRVEVNPIFQGTYDETADKLLAAMRGGDLPSMVQLEETRIQLGIDSQAMLPAQACIDAAGYDTGDHLPRIIDQFTVEDVLWPMPFQSSNPVLYWNTIAFEQAGLGEDDVPTTLEELRDVSEQLVEAGVVPHGIAFELRPWQIEQWFAMADQPLLDNDNGRSGRAGEVNLDTEIAEELFGTMGEMVESGAATSVGRNESGFDHFLAIGNGEAAMTIGTSAAIGQVLEVLGSGQFDDVGMGVAPLPGPDEGGVLTGGGANWIVERDATDEEKAAAWDFASWLNEPDVQARWHEATGYIPVRESAVELPEVQALWEGEPAYRVAYDQLLASEASFGGPVVGDYAELREAVIEALERIVLQGAEPVDALAQAKQRADAAIADYNDRVGG